MGALRELGWMALAVGTWLALLSYVLANGLYTVQLVCAAAQLRRTRLRERLLSFQWWHRLPSLPTVSVLVPAYNEQETVVDAVTGTLTLEYPELQVVVVNDGSSDQTMARLVDAFDLEVDASPPPGGELDTSPVRAVYRSRSRPRLMVVDKDNGGKADALNVGLNVAYGQYVVSLDADTIVAPDALPRLVQGFAGRDDVVAVGGTVRPVNGLTVDNGRVDAVGQLSRSTLAAAQTVEYLRAYYLGRLGWNRLGGNVIISGAFGMFDRRRLLAAGGYQRDSLGEDFELVVRLRRLGYEQGGPSHVEFLADPIAYTEAPEDWSVLQRQRSRWHRGLLDTLRQHRTLLFNRRYGRLGFGPLAFFTVVEAVGPVLEAAAPLLLLTAWALGALSGTFALQFALIAYLWAALLSLASVAADVYAVPTALSGRDRLRQVAICLVEPVLYRPVTVWWRTVATVQWLTGRKAEWGRMTRRGFTAG